LQVFVQGSGGRVNHIAFKKCMTAAAAFCAVVDTILRQAIGGLT
jgi:hypothetical protein